MSSDGSVFSRTSSTTMNDARVVSKATATATIAAKSILSSGANEETAMKTAKAAAQSVLLQQCITSSDSKAGPLRRRKIKQKADVIASMALANAMHDITPPGGQDSDDILVKLRQLQNQLDDLDNRSAMSGYSSAYGESTTASRSPRKSGPFGSMTKTFASFLGGGSKMSTVQEERSPKPPRPVNITIENQASPNKSKGEESSSEDKSKNSKETKSSQGTNKVSNIGDIHIPRNHSTTSKVNMILSPSRQRKESNELTTTLSADDPIYYMESRQESVREDDRYESLNRHSSSSSVDSDDDDDDDMGAEEESLLYDDETVESHHSLNTYETATTHKTQKSFMEKSVDPCLFGFWACATTPNKSSSKKVAATPANLGANESDVSSVASDELLRGLRSDVITNYTYSGALEGSIRFEKREASVALIEDPDTREDIEGIFEDLSGSPSATEEATEMKSGKKAAAWKKFKRVVGRGKRQMSPKASVTIAPAASASAE